MFNHIVTLAKGTGLEERNGETACRTKECGEPSEFEVIPRQTSSTSNQTVTGDSVNPVRDADTQLANGCQIISW